MLYTIRDLRRTELDLRSPAQLIDLHWKVDDLRRSLISGIAQAVAVLAWCVFWAATFQDVPWLLITQSAIAAVELAILIDYWRMLIETWEHEEFAVRFIDSYRRDRL